MVPRHQPFRRSAALSAKHCVVTQTIRDGEPHFCELEPHNGRLRAVDSLRCAPEDLGRRFHLSRWCAPSLSSPALSHIAGPTVIYHGRVLDLAERAAT